MNRQDQKQMLLDEVKESLISSPSWMAVSYKGLTASRSVILRKSIAESGGSFVAIKKRLLVIVLQQALGLSTDVDSFPGHIALIPVGRDPALTAKAVVDFNKQSDDALNIVYGVLDGMSCSADDWKAIAALPSQHQMRAEFLGILQAPGLSLVSAIDALLSSPLSLLEEKQKKEPAG